VFSGVFRVEEDDELGDNGQETAHWLIQETAQWLIYRHYWRIFERALDICLFTEVLTGKKQHFCLG
jgi:hypothetical protein